MHSLDQARHEAYVKRLQDELKEAAEARKELRDMLVFLLSRASITTYERLYRRFPRRTHMLLKLSLWKHNSWLEKEEKNPSGN